MSESVLRNLMDHGFVIFLGDTSGDNKFCIGKIKTVLDGRSQEELLQHVLEYKTYDSALEAAQYLSGMIPPPKINQMWQVQIMYKHRGRGVLVADLEPVVETEYNLALHTAKDKGEAFVKSFSKGDIERWEVKVRPCGIVKEASQVR